MTNTENNPSKLFAGKGCLIYALVGVLLCVTAIVLFEISTREFFHSIMVGKTGPVSSPDGWPKPLKELQLDRDHANLPITNVQIYCLCQGMDPEYVWRMDAAPGLLAYLKLKWELTQVAEPTGVMLDGRSTISGETAPSWWNPTESKNTDFYVCARTLARTKGDRFQVAFDKDRMIIFVRYWFNF
jgi:hypothetical protein